MANVKRITNNDKLIGFSIDGEIFPRNFVWEESKSMRGLANRVFNELLNCDQDTSDDAKELIAADQARIDEIKRTLSRWREEGLISSEWGDEDLPENLSEIEKQLRSIGPGLGITKEN